VSVPNLAIRSLRVFTRSLRAALCRKTATVEGAMPSSYAISLFGCPRLANATTCRSLSVGKTDGRHAVALRNEIPFSVGFKMSDKCPARVNESPPGRERAAVGALTRFGAQPLECANRIGEPVSSFLLFGNAPSVHDSPILLDCRLSFVDRWVCLDATTKARGGSEMDGDSRPSGHEFRRRRQLVGKGEPDPNPMVGRVEPIDDKNITQAGSRLGTHLPSRQGLFPCAARLTGQRARMASERPSHVGRRELPGHGRDRGDHRVGHPNRGGCQ